VTVTAAAAAAADVAIDVTSRINRGA